MEAAAQAGPAYRALSHPISGAESRFIADIYPTYRSLREPGASY
jgi:hypothetical protein